MAKPQSLDDRLKKHLAGAIPKPASMIPSKAVHEPEVLPEMAEVVESRAVQGTLLRLISSAAELARTENDAKKARKPLTDQIKKLMEEHSTSPKFMVDGMRVNLYDTARSTLSKEKLLELGVSSTIIAKATVTSHSSSLKITLPGEDDGD